MDILIGTGEVVHATPDNEHADLFFGFPNSYGSLGYALLLEIELEPVSPFVALRHLRFAHATAAAGTIAEIVASGQWEGQRVDYLDGTVFGAAEIVLTLGSYASTPRTEPSDYTGQRIYYRSLRRRDTDLLRVADYLWRWDTDWFWCSKSLGAQHPLVRRVWPKRYLRSDAYWKIAALERRYQAANRIRGLRGMPLRESVIQDVEVPLPALPEFLDFFHREVGILPVWLCPLRQRDPDRRWPLYEFADPLATYVNLGFWSSVARERGADPSDGRVNKRIESEVTRLGGKKSLYSTASYHRDDFDRLYGGIDYAALKARYDPSGRFADMYAKCVTTA
jgi:FAD/FMN-containing dehydrogenase